MLYLLVLVLSLFTITPSYAQKTQLMQEDISYVNPLKYGTALNATTLQAAITGIGAAKRTLFLSTGTWTLSSNVTVPSTIFLLIPAGTVVNVSGGSTLTINGQYYAFEKNWYTGTVVFNNIVWGNPESFNTAFSNYVVSGGFHSTSGSLVSASFSTRAWIAGYDIKETSAITYAANASDVCWTILSLNTTAIASWTQVGTTHYYYFCQHNTVPVRPTIPANTLPLMEITVTGSAITRVDKIFTTKLVTESQVVGKANILDFGGIGDGVSDNYDALRLALTTGPYKCVYIPEGTFYTSLPYTQTNGTLCLEGSGMGLSIILAKISTIPSCVAGGNNELYSNTILKLTSLTNVTVNNITFNGGATTGAYCNNGTYLDQHSLIEIRTSSHINFNRLETTKYAGSQAAQSAGGTMDPSGLTFSQNFGPIYIDNSSDIEMLHSRSSAPSFNEGWFITESHDILIDGFYSNAGKPDHVQYGQSSPLAIFGITDNAHSLKIINSTFINSNGSVGIYLTKNIQLLNNNFDAANSGFIMWDSFLGAGLALPNSVNGAIPIIDNVVITNNNFYDIKGYCTTLGKSATPGTTRASNVTFSNNICRRAAGGYIGGDTVGLTINGNKFTEIQENVPGQLASGISASDLSRVSITNNTFDGSVSGANGVGNCANGAGCRTLRNIELSNCDICDVKDNIINDAVQNNIYIGVATDNTYGSISVTNNTIKNVTVIPTLPLSVGTDITHRLKDAYLNGNTINNAQVTSLSGGGNSAVYAVNPLSDLNTVQAYRNGASAGLTGTVAIVIWNGLEYDSWLSASNVPVLNTATGVFTTPPGRRGFQQINGAISVTSLADTRSVLCYLYIGGVLKKQLFSIPNGTGVTANMTIPFSTTAYVDGSTTIDIRCASDDPANPVLTGTTAKTFITLQFAGSF